MESTPEDSREGQPSGHPVDPPHYIVNVPPQSRGIFYVALITAIIASAAAIISGISVAKHWNAARIQNRSFVMAVEVSGQVSVGQSPQLTAVIASYGNTPISNLEIYISADTAERPSRHVHADSLVLEELVWHANKYKSIEFRPAFSITDSVQARIETQRLRLFCCIFARYTDVFQLPCSTAFTGQFNPVTGRFKPIGAQNYTR